MADPDNKIDWAKDLTGGVVSRMCLFLAAKNRLDVAFGEGSPSYREPKFFYSIVSIRPAVGHITFMCEW